MTNDQANDIYLGIYADMISRGRKFPSFNHNKTTSTMEINLIGKQLFGKKFLGSFPQDKMPKKMLSNKTYYAIINVDTSNMKGSHWIAVAGIPKSKKIMIFDSFGRMTKKLLPLIYNSAKNSGVIDTQYDKEQKIIQDSCGQYSMAWLIFFDIYGFKNAQKI